MKSHLLSAADLDRDEALAILDTAERMHAVADPRGQEAAAAARPHRRQPVLRGLHPHPHLVRDRRQVAVGRRHQRQRQGLERQQGREPARHRAHRRGDGRRRAGRAAQRLGRGRTGIAELGATATSSTPATARTSTRPRRCSTRTRCAAGSGDLDRPARRRSSATSLHSRVARSNVLLLRTLGARVTLVAPPTLMPSGVGSWPCATSWDLDAVLSGKAHGDVDAVMMLRVQRERMSGGYFPTEREYAHRLRPVARRGSTCSATHVADPAPRPDEPRPGDLLGRGRRARARWSRPGAGRRVGADGRALPAAGRRRRGRRS